MTKADLPSKLHQILITLNGESTIIRVCKAFWEEYENELRNSEDLFYTWQYDIRWAATKLRKSSIMINAETSPFGIWQLSK